MNYELRIMNYGKEKQEALRLRHDSAFILHTSSQNGFTIIETLVAIAILLLSISAPLTIAEKGLASAEVARQEITAFYLAQEAMEYIRNIRDTNALSGHGGQSNWLQGINSQCFDEPAAISGCGIDTTAPESGQQIRGCSSENMVNCRLLQYTADNDPIACAGNVLCGLFGHRYSQGGWTETDFLRRVFIEEIQVDGKDDEAKITVRLDWTAGSLGSRTLTVSENILNWYDSQ